MKRAVRAGSPEIVKVAGGDSSPCSAEASFRELDDVFLQTQTRIWLGEVLHIRFDEETAIADLLADGELLFQVSKVVWKMLLKKDVELKHSKLHIYERTSSGRSNGKYLPYPKVDSFLKICQILGLTGVDLFSPSDVVEKRDVRRVCMCIRSFSKKARSKNLNVPDFDIVTYTIAMPTDLVGGIRRNLEQSQYSPSSSNSSGSWLMDLRELYRQKSPDAQSPPHYDSNSEWDEAESAFTEFEFQSSNVSYDAINFSSVIGHESSEGNSVANGHLSELQTQFKLDVQEQIEMVNKRSMHNCSHELKITVPSDSSSMKVEILLNPGGETSFVNTKEAVSPLRNPRNAIEIKDANASSYQNYASTEGHSLYDLHGLHAVDAEDFILSSPTLWRSLENNLAKRSSSDGNTTLDCPKEEFMNAVIGPPSCQAVDDGVRLKCMERLDISNMSELQRTVETPQRAPAEDAEGKKEKSSANTFPMDLGNPSDDELPPPGDYMELQADASNLCFHSIGDGNNTTMPTNSSSSIGSVNPRKEDVQKGFRRQETNELEVAQEHCSSISWEDKYADNDYSADTFNFLQANSPKQVDASGSVIDMSATDHDSKPCIDVNRNECRICSGQDCHTSEVEGHSDTSTCDLEMGAEEQVNSWDLSTVDGDMASCHLLIRESKVSESMTLDASEKQLMAIPFDSPSEEAMEMKIAEEEDASHHPCGMYKIPPREDKEENIEELNVQDSYPADDLSIPQISLLHASSREPWEEIPIPKVDGIADRKVSTPACINEREISPEEGKHFSYEEEALIVGDVSSMKELEGADGNRKIKKEPEENVEELVPKLSDPREKAKGSKVLKSVAGAMTLLGALFLLHHVRQRRGKNKNAGPILLQQNGKQSQEIPEHTITGSVKPTVLYPGEKLKF